jgi:hypothetical protein
MYRPAEHRILLRTGSPAAGRRQGREAHHRALASPCSQRKGGLGWDHCDGGIACSASCEPVIQRGGRKSGPSVGYWEAPRRPTFLASHPETHFLPAHTSGDDDPRRPARHFPVASRPFSVRLSSRGFSDCPPNTRTAITGGHLGGSPPAIGTYGVPQPPVRRLKTRQDPAGNVDLTDPRSGSSRRAGI